MKFLRPGFWQKLIMALLIFVELSAMIVLIVLLAVRWTNGTQATLYVVLVAFLLDVAVEVYIVNTDSPIVYKLTWMFFVSSLPFLGALLYFMFANKTTNRSQKKKYEKWSSTLQKSPTDPAVMSSLESQNPDGAQISKYIEFASEGGIYQNSDVTYFSLADEAYPVLLRELQKAKHYIFLEIFIIAPGVFWDSVLRILKEKAQAGLDVRVMYDDVGTLGTVPFRYFKQLQKFGIKAEVFSPIKPFFDIRMNNRDHRKILVIDGHTCFTGGYNIADEYINRVVHYGHWKDNGIMIKGDAVYGFTSLFLSNWNANFDPHAKTDYEYYKTTQFKKEDAAILRPSGFVQPYGDLPFDKEAVGETVYLSIIQRAKKYVYLSTPYLIIDENMEDSLLTAAKQGIDVRILTPHIPDKKAVFNITRSFYGPLIKAGVKIYEYTPGFVHEKMFVSDDNLATIGTINLDYRSLFLHLECGTFLAQCDCIANMKQDFLDSLALSHQVSLDEWEQWHTRQKSYWAILRILAPLL